MPDAPFERPLSLEELQRRTEALFERVIRIGHMAFGEMAHSPTPGGLAPPAPPAQAGKPRAATAPQTRMIKSLPERLDLTRARARLPFALRLPTWVPNGFGTTGEISVTGGGFGSVEPPLTPGADASHPPVAFPLSVHALWRHLDGRGFRLTITRLPEDQSGFFARGITPVPPGAVREVAVRGVPAALIERQFHHMQPSGEVDINDDAQLTWEDGGRGAASDRRVNGPVS